MNIHNNKADNTVKNSKNIYYRADEQKVASMLGTDG